MARTSTDRGKEFLTGVLQHLPDHLRSGLETFLTSDEATALLTQVGTGVLRQDEFSRQLDALRADRTSLETWKTQLEEYQATHMSGEGPTLDGGHPRRVATPDPATPAAATGLTEEAVKDLLSNELGRREVYFASFVADANRMAQEHFLRFGEVLDVQKLLQHPRLAELRLQGAYEDLFKDKIAAYTAAQDAKAREKLEAEIRAQVVAELSAGPGNTPLYPVGDSPLDHLTKPGETPAPWDPMAATRMYEQLVANRG